MRVRVLFFGMLRELAEKSGDAVELREGATVGDLLKECEARVPKIKESTPSLAVAVNQQYAAMGTVLKNDDEVALLPPVSGGAEGETPPSTGAGQASAQPALRRRYAAIVRDAIKTSEVAVNLKRGEDGAAVVFEGVVRNHTRGRKTLYLDYEAYEEMALQEMERLAEQALKQFQIRDVALAHRLGRIEIGEVSVLIVVASAHRAAAFDACRWLIDTLKRTVPIWKKEYFEDGAVWADGEAFPAEMGQANFRGQGSP
jgi:molybdopterin synthase catalytic subunit